jgi:hypothetical protein
MELANESRRFDEGRRPPGRSGTATVKEGMVCLVDTWEGRGGAKAEEGKKEEAEAKFGLDMGSGDEMGGRVIDASSGFGGEMRGRESSNFRS